MFNGPAKRFFNYYWTTDFFEHHYNDTGGIGEYE